MIQCTDCLISKPDEEFNWKIRNVRRHRKCKACTKVRKARHYKKNRSDYLKKQIVNNKKLVLRNKQFISNYLLTQKCVDCGNNDFRVLDFDHIDPKTKVFNISVTKVQNFISLEKLQAEISKCVIRCANCHRIRHFEEKRLRSSNGRTTVFKTDSVVGSNPTGDA